MDIIKDFRIDKRITYEEALMDILIPPNTTLYITSCRAIANNERYGCETFVTKELEEDLNGPIEQILFTQTEAFVRDYLKEHGEDNTDGVSSKE
jgi:hypothetical protein